MILFPSRWRFSSALVALSWLALFGCTEQPEPLQVGGEPPASPALTPSPSAPPPQASSKLPTSALPAINLTGNPYQDARAKLAPRQPYAFSLDYVGGDASTWQVKGKTDGRAHGLSYSGKDPEFEGEWLAYGHSAYKRNTEGRFIAKPFEAPGITQLAELLNRLPASLNGAKREADDFFGSDVVARFDLSDSQGVLSLWLDESRLELKQLRYQAQDGSVTTLALSEIRTVQQIPRKPYERGPTGFGPH